MAFKCVCRVTNSLKKKNQFGFKNAQENDCCSEKLGQYYIFKKQIERSPRQ